MKEPKDKKYKKCGHEVGYKCCCNYSERPDKVFDTVDEMNLRREKRTK